MGDLEICILAGGLSSRMGRDKAGMRLGRKTLAGHVRANAAGLGLPMRTIRKDLVVRCGPLGGIYSGLKTTRHGGVLFLACDMPFVFESHLRRLLKEFAGRRAVFARSNGVPGFPAVLPRASLAAVEAAIEKGALSVHGLARRLGSRYVAMEAESLTNINTPRELAAAKKRWVSAQEQLVKRR